eukprot:2102925-Pyramimonas_sp.AAC.1
MGPTGYFRKLGPKRGAIEDLALQVMKLRCCHFDCKLNRSSRSPSCPCPQVATTRPRIPVDPWTCTRRVAARPWRPEGGMAKPDNRHHT